MKRIGLAAAALSVSILLFAGRAWGQSPDNKGPSPKQGAFPKGGRGFGGGFERPLSAEPRRGNPGASPSLTDADFREVIAHAKEFDANGDGKLTKDELPEMFLRFFQRADTNSDGFLDQDEMSRVLAPASPKATTAPPKTAKGS